MPRLIRSACLTGYVEIALSFGLDPFRLLKEAGLDRSCLLDPDTKISIDKRLRHVERIHAGIARARIKGTQSGKPIGRPWIDKRKEATIRAELAKGTGILKTARLCKVGTGTVQRIKREMTRAL